jgi:hypothetical protein
MEGSNITPTQLFAILAVFGKLAVYGLFLQHPLYTESYPDSADFVQGTNYSKNISKLLTTVRSPSDNMQNTFHVST